MVKCTSCEYEAKSNAGLSMHKKKHVVKTDINATGHVNDTVAPEFPATVVGDPVKIDRLSQVEDRLDKLTDLLTMVVERQSHPIKVDTTTTSQSQTTVQTPIVINDMIPTSWRQKVNEILGEEFEVRLADSSGGNYTLFVTVPSQWDRRGKGQTGADLSTGLIRRASDVSDVEHWCKKIRETIVKVHPSFA